MTQTKHVVHPKNGRNPYTQNRFYCRLCSAASYLKRRSYLQAWHRKKKYGISGEQIEELRKKQKGKCAICGRGLRPNVRGRIQDHVDHNHKTKKVRGILCFHCNSGLGQFHDSAVLLESAAAYLRAND